MDKVRLDRFLWASRFYKTRSLSTDACKRNWISVNDLTAKPSKEVRIGDIIKIKKSSHYRSIKIIVLLNKRVGASKVEDYIEDITSPEEIEKEREHNQNRKLFNLSTSHKGRPSKKQRRDLEEFLYHGGED
ncbi:RNA-binding S4 domain-containing protein [Candidatus Seribacter sulfatis]|uniref:RNA-binding S4 domain-containing protein n=1 Tax=Candidatus Seribacter sulfatis TaxID=3381756 RepID=UPI00389B21B3